jgi:hypothetical protein
LVPITSLGKFYEGIERICFELKASGREDLASDVNDSLRNNFTAVEIVGSCYGSLTRLAGLLDSLSDRCRDLISECLEYVRHYVWTEKWRVRVTVADFHGALGGLSPWVFDRVEYLTQPIPLSFDLVAGRLLTEISEQPPEMIRELAAQLRPADQVVFFQFAYRSASCAIGEHDSGWVNLGVLAMALGGLQAGGDAAELTLAALWHAAVRCGGDAAEVFRVAAGIGLESSSALSAFARNPCPLDAAGLKETEGRMGHFFEAAGS